MAVKEATKSKYQCDRCEFSGKNQGGLNIHQSRMHAIKGKGKNSTRQKATKVLDGQLELAPMERGEMIYGEANMGIAAMLEVVFPAGIPYDKIRHATDWVLATEKLLDGLPVS